MINKLRDSYALAFTNDGSKRFFPFMFTIAWRDGVGFNPGFIVMTTQTGQRDPHLLPNGFRNFVSSWFLFGGRNSTGRWGRT